jgi:hypothetical protein
MMYLDVCTVVAWFIATLILIVDLRSIRAALEQERAETRAELERRKLIELTQARLAHERHAELISILLANIVPACPVSVAELSTPETSEDAPQTPREPAVTRSQQPPAPPLSVAEPDALIRSE